MRNYSYFENKMYSEEFAATVKEEQQVNFQPILEYFQQGVFFQD